MFKQRAKIKELERTVVELSDRIMYLKCETRANQESGNLLWRADDRHREDFQYLLDYLNIEIVDTPAQRTVRPKEGGKDGRG